MSEMPNADPVVACVMLVNGREDMVRRAVASFHSQTYRNKRLVSWPGASGKTIGEYRNEAAAACPWASIIAHWDSDDWSVPARIESQVKLLRHGYDAVAYHSMLFWDATRKQAWTYHAAMPHLCLGTSLAYWRTTWERHAMPRTDPEDTAWWRTIRAAGVATLSSGHLDPLTLQPRMIQGVHGGNTCARIVEGAPEWKRAPQWDEHCRIKMEIPR